MRYEDVLEEMNQRDHNDSTREIAPATAAEDAILFDNTGMTAEQSADAVIAIIREKTGGAS